MISISFFVLLLTTYCYSVPVDPRFSTTTSSILPTPGKTFDTHVVSSEESTTIGRPVHGVRGTVSSEERLFSTSTIKPMTGFHSSEETKGPIGTKPLKPVVPTSSEERLFSSTTIKPMTGFHSSEETKGPMGKKPLKPIVPTSSEERLFSSTTVRPFFEHHSSEETMRKNLNKFHTSTMETKSQFNKRAIKSTGSGSSEEMTTVTTPEFPKVNVEVTVNKTFRSPSTSRENSNEKPTSSEQFETTTVPMKMGVDTSREGSNEKPTSSEKFETTTVPMKMGVDRSRESSNEKPTSSEKFFTTTVPKTMGVDRSRENSNEQNTSGEKFGKTTGLLGNRKTFSSEDRSFEKHRKTIMNPTTPEPMEPVEIIKTIITVEKQPVFEKTMSDN